MRFRPTTAACASAAPSSPRLPGHYWKNLARRAKIHASVSGLPESIGRSMAVTISLPPTISKKRAGLDVWMERALDKASNIEPEWDADEVHDLRVALRRCRTMAEALSEVSASSGWRKLKKASRGLFHALGRSSRYAGAARLGEEAGRGGRSGAETRAPPAGRRGKESSGSSPRRRSMGSIARNGKSWRASCRPRRDFFPSEASYSSAWLWRSSTKPSSSTSRRAKGAAPSPGTGCGSA